MSVFRNTRQRLGQILNLSPWVDNFAHYVKKVKVQGIIGQPQMTSE